VARPQGQGSLLLNPSGGNVGIGTTEPGAKLTVDPQGSGGLTVGNSKTIGNTVLELSISQIKDGNATLQAWKSVARPQGQGSLLLNPSGGNVGIGTTEPAARLSLGQANGQALLIHQNDGQSVRSGFGVDLTGANCELNMFFPETGRLSIGTVSKDEHYSYSEKMQVTADGHVGIGTSAIYTEGWNKVLDILGTGHARLNVRSSGGVITSVFSHDNWDGAKGGFGTVSNHPLTFTTGNTHRMTIDIAGNVGIGTTVPENSEGWGRVLDLTGPGANAKLSVRSANIDGRVLVHEQSWYGARPGMIVGTKTAHSLSFATANATRMAIDTSGNVGIGTTDPKQSLHVKGFMALEGSDHTYIEYYPDGFSNGRKAWMGFGNVNDNNLTISNQIAGAQIVLQPNAGIVSVRGTLEVASEIRGKIAFSGPYRWEQGKPAVKLIHSSKGFAILSHVQGKFEGVGEFVRVYVASDGYWYLGGASGQVGVTAEAYCIGGMQLP
jgi:hypothetical protein